MTQSWIPTTSVWRTLTTQTNNRLQLEPGLLSGNSTSFIIYTMIIYTSSLVTFLWRHTDIYTFNNYKQPSADLQQLHVSTDRMETAAWSISLMLNWWVQWYMIINVPEATESQRQQTLEPHWRLQRGSTAEEHVLLWMSRGRQQRARKKETNGKYVYRIFYHKSVDDFNDLICHMARKVILFK